MSVHATPYAYSPPAAARRSRAVAVWLCAMAALVFAMVIVGGATRLTDSGLSITEWRPLLGAIPPMSEAAWLEAFEKYRQIPEYQLVNKGMSLEAFKFIYWWEWAHRFLGRVIGVAFLLPFLFFVATGRIGLAQSPRFVALFALGGAQGALGWYMVQSGLSERVDVSQYRLAAHLSLATLIYAAIVWMALNWRGGTGRASAAPRAATVSALGFLALLFVQIALGGFVAGLDAGKTHNTWPLMDGHFVPLSLGELSPWWRDLFENVSTIQFAHRLTAYALVFWGLAIAVAAWRSEGLGRIAKASALWLGLCVLAQAALGVWTVLEAVPLWLGLAHQGGAFILLAVGLWHVRALRAGH